MSKNSIFSLTLRQFIILNLITLTQPSGWQLQSPLRKPLFQRKRKMRGFLLSKSPSCSQRMKAVFLTRWSILMYEYVWQQHACVSRGRSLTHIYMLGISVVTVVEFLSETSKIQKILVFKCTYSKEFCWYLVKLFGPYPSKIWYFQGSE